MTNKPDGRSIPVRQDVVMPEVARLYREVEADRDRWKAGYEEYHELYDRAGQEIERLRADLANAELRVTRLSVALDAQDAEVERLQAALRRLAAASDWHPDDMQAFARAALARHEEC